MPPDEKQGAIAEETRGDPDDGQPQSFLLKCLFLSRKKMIDPFLHKAAGYVLGYRQFLLGLDLKLYF